LSSHAPDRRTTSRPMQQPQERGATIMAVGAPADTAPGHTPSDSLLRQLLDQHASEANRAVGRRDDSQALARPHRPTLPAGPGRHLWQRPQRSTPARPDNAGCYSPLTTIQLPGGGPPSASALALHPLPPRSITRTQPPNAPDNKSPPPGRGGSGPTPSKTRRWRPKSTSKRRRTGEHTT